jgi:hypothetical protein
MITRRTVFAIANWVERSRRPARASQILKGFTTRSLSPANTFPQKTIFLSYTLTVLRREIRLRASKNENLGRLISPIKNDWAP